MERGNTDARLACKVPLRQVGGQIGLNDLLSRRSVESFARRMDILHSPTMADFPGGPLVGVSKTDTLFRRTKASFLEKNDTFKLEG